MARFLKAVLGYSQALFSVKRSKKLAYLPDIRLLGLDEGLLGISFGVKI